MAVASHGHTVFHQPEKGLSFQIGNGWALHQASGETILADFRMLDVQLGGQGAPLVPIGDRLLFPQVDFCINLGGISNLSLEKNEQRIAFDCSPFNLLLNREAQKLGDSTLIAQVYSDVGAVHFRKGDYQQSKENYLKCLKIRKARKDTKGIAKVQNNLGSIYERTFDYKKSMESFLEALAYFESINDQKNTLTIKGNIGLVLLKLKDYPKAKKYIQEEIDFETKFIKLII